MKKQLQFLALLGLFLMAILFNACARSGRFKGLQIPPGGLQTQDVPQFIVFGNDDVGYSGLEESGGAGGLHYLTELFASRKHQNGQPLHYSFYVNTIYITSKGKEDPRLVKQAWKEALEHGHEIGVHTHSHPHGREFSVDQWKHEMQLCIDHLVQGGFGLTPQDLIGFRTPFLEYGDQTLTAAERMKFAYDCSIEEGFQPEADGRNFVWPYKLDHGSPGNSATYKSAELPLVRKHPGLWELPVYAFIVPPDELCEKYGVQSGLRARLNQRQNYFETDQGKITGFDWNLWYEFGMDKPEFVATLKHTLDLHLQGNRSPMTLGLHTDIYADKNPEKPPQTTPQERREAVREFLDYALSKPEVRVVSAREFLTWFQAPTPLSKSYDDHSNKRPLGAGFRHIVYNPKTPTNPDYWARVAREMSARFPGAATEAIWIVSRVKVKEKEKGTQISFPIEKKTDPLITDDEEDRNEKALQLFDKLGFRIWLQVEPGFAPVEEVLELVLERYKHHPSVIGIGVDVEWYKSTDPDAGEPVTDIEARKWLALARKHNPNYRLFLKHWLIEKMPPTVREGLLFVDDSQIFPAMEPMIKEFGEWAKAFAPAPVAFQYGYPSDRPWWSKLKDAPKEIGMRILQVAPNTEGLFWVDYSALDVFPENQKEVQ